VEDYDLNEPVKLVVLDAMVALKIVQHSRQNMPTPVTGQLLGLDLAGNLEVTNSFPLPLRLEDDHNQEPSTYEVEMMKYLREINVDNNAVGWYQSTYTGLHINQFLIETQFGYQSNIKGSVVLIYDPQVSSHGSLSIRAFRLSTEFLNLYKCNKLTSENAAEKGVSFDNMLVEVPVRISTNGLATALVTMLEANEDLIDQFESLDLSSEDFFMKNLELLLGCFSDLQREQGNRSYFARNMARLEQAQQAFLTQRKADNIQRKKKGMDLLSEDPHDLVVENPSLFKKPSEPSCLEALLVANRAATHCEDITKFAAKQLSKQFILQSLERTGDSP
jgi:translation initiation factor 3 subunit H